MSLFQCEECGCCENTALSPYWLCKLKNRTVFDWSEIEDRKGKELCSACSPIKYKDGLLTGYGEWHGKFDRVFLPIGMFKTNRVGNLEHIETGSEDFGKYAIESIGKDQ